MTSAKGLARREDIIRTAGELFAEKGIPDVSVNDIVNRMSIAKGTFYHYFASKEELVSLFVQRLCKAHADELRAITADESRSFRARLRSCLEKFYEMALDAGNRQGKCRYPELLRQEWQDEFVGQASDILADFMEYGKALGEVRVSQPRLLTLITAAGVQALWQRRCNGRCPPAPEDYHRLLAAAEEIFHLEPGSLQKPE